MLRLATLLFLLAAAPVGFANDRLLTLGAATSTDNSGFLNHLLPLFRAESGIGVRVLTAGTGQILAYARRGDVDAVLVHDRASEDELVAQGYGIERRDVMFNDYVLVGPPEDPADLAGLADAVQALRRIAQTQAPFISRGDDSGTHKRELHLWDLAGVTNEQRPHTWYKESGAGQGATLNLAGTLGAYALTDRATWLSFRNPGRLQLLVQGDRQLVNQYGVIAVNPAAHPHVNHQAAAAFVDWLGSEPGSKAIDAFRIAGEQAFFANGRPRP